MTLARGVRLVRAIPSAIRFEFDRRAGSHRSPCARGSPAKERTATWSGGIRSRRIACRSLARPAASRASTPPSRTRGRVFRRGNFPASRECLCGGFVCAVPVAAAGSGGGRNEKEVSGKTPEKSCPKSYSEQTEFAVWPESTRSTRRPCMRSVWHWGTMPRRPSQPGDPDRRRHAGIRPVDRGTGGGRHPAAGAHECATPA